jgi:Ca2+-binding EF-hand superfamily protein
MKKIVSMLVCATVVLMVAGAAMAGEKGKGKGPGGFFAKDDADKDGKLSLVEFKATCKDPAKGEAKFTAADADKDGFLTPAELKAARPAPAKKAEKAACDKAAAPVVPVAPAAQ